MSLDVPESCDLPFFSYGCFQPGEPAHRRIAKFLDVEPVFAAATGRLMVRDGLPLLDISNESSFTEGALLNFGPDWTNDAYTLVSEFEPRALYRWERITLLEPKSDALCVVGRKLGHGNAEPMEDTTRWSHALDPVFGAGMVVIGEGVERFRNYEFQPAPPNNFDWQSFFRAQMLYLLLWSAVERYCSLAYGPALDPVQRILNMGADPMFGKALAGGDIQDREVFDSRDPGSRYRLLAEDPISACKYYYQVRSNLSHRGKGAWKDGETVRLSLCELFNILDQMLGH